MSAIFRVKPLSRLIADSERSGHQLKRTLGPLQLTSLGVGPDVSTSTLIQTSSTARYATLPSCHDPAGY